MEDAESNAAAARAPCAVDLFAGAGGFSLGAIQSGFEIRAAVEKDGHAVKSYRRNVRNASGRRIAVFEGDIRDVGPFDVMVDAGLTKGQCDLLLGGPPCQGFSSHRLGRAGVDDPRNELLLRYFSFVEALRPRTFLLENVPGLLQPKHVEYLNRFVRKANECRYEIIGPVVLNARDFGVPQNRKRVFILGVCMGVAGIELRWPPVPTHTKPDLARENGMPPWRTAAEAFIPKELPDDPNAIHMNHGEALVEAFRSTPANGGSRSHSNRVLPCHAGHRGHHDVYGRICVDHPSPTMTTACINPSKGRFVHPYEHHGITARQAARLQTFPDDFFFEGGLMAAGVQIGNAVPVRLARILCNTLHEMLTSPATQNSKLSFSHYGPQRKVTEIASEMKI